MFYANFSLNGGGFYFDKCKICPKKIKLKYQNNKKTKYQNIKISKYQNIKLSKNQNIKISKYQIIKKLLTL
jgi:hypothetical protein